MNYNTQNAKIASITEKTLIVGIDVGSEAYYTRVFDWRNYEYTRKPLEFSNTEFGFQTFKTQMEGIAEKYGKTAIIPGMETTGHYWFALGIDGLPSIFLNIREVHCRIWKGIHKVM